MLLDDEPDEGLAAGAAAGLAGVLSEPPDDEPDSDDELDAGASDDEVVERLSLR